MDQIEKFIRKLDRKTALRVLKALADIQGSKLSDYDFRKIKGFQDLYRIRIGKIRIIFRQKKDSTVVISIHYRGSVYKNI